MRYPGICAAVFGLAAVMSLGLAACGAVQDESSTAERSAAREESAVETVTDVNGQAVLDENGEPMTEIVTVAAVVRCPAPMQAARRMGEGHGRRVLPIGIIYSQMSRIRQINRGKRRISIPGCR